MDKKKQLISEQLRQAIDASTMSRAEICKAIKMPESSMSKFMNRKMGMSLAYIDKVGTVLGLDIVARKGGKDQ